jgi:hypothetical protein
MGLIRSHGTEIWEFTVLLSVLGGYAYWHSADRTRFGLGLYMGFSICFGWTWLFDMPFLLNLSFNPAAAGGFVWAGHWEPLWTAFSYAALGAPMVWYNVTHARITARFGLWRSPLVAYGIAIPVQFYEGSYGIGFLGIEHYHWRPSFLALNVPWTNGAVLVPLMIGFAMLFTDALRSFIPAGELPPVPSLPRRFRWSGAGRPASFAAGFAAPQAGFYLTFLAMMPLLQHLQPWLAPSAPS